MNANFFVKAARHWNRVMQCAQQAHAPATEQEAARRHRDASMKRARAFKMRDALRAQIAQREADEAIQAYANAL